MLYVLHILQISIHPSMGNHLTSSAYSLDIPITQPYPSTHSCFEKDTHLSFTHVFPCQSLSVRRVVMRSLSQLKPPQSCAWCLSQSLHLSVSEIFPGKKNIIKSSSRDLSVGKISRGFTFVRQWSSWNSYSTQFE